jgi:MtN3 and saliva related transmembrane protein
MEPVTLVGYVAALCSMISFSPQAWKVIKTRDTSSIAAPMYAVSVVAFAFWLVFGVMKGEWAIIVTNAVCLVLSSFILIITLLPTAKKEAVAEALDSTISGTQP